MSAGLPAAFFVCFLDNTSSPPSLFGCAYPLPTANSPLRCFYTVFLTWLSFSLFHRIVRSTQMPTPKHTRALTSAARAHEPVRACACASLCVYAGGKDADAPTVLRHHSFPLLRRGRRCGWGGKCKGQTPTVDGSGPLLQFCCICEGKSSFFFCVSTSQCRCACAVRLCRRELSMHPCGEAPLFLGL